MHAENGLRASLQQPFQAGQTAIIDQSIGTADAMGPVDNDRETDFPALAQQINHHGIVKIHIGDHFPHAPAAAVAIFPQQAAEIRGRGIVAETGIDLAERRQASGKPAAFANHIFGRRREIPAVRAVVKRQHDRDINAAVIHLANQFSGRKRHGVLPPQAADMGMKIYHGCFSFRI